MNSNNKLPAYTNWQSGEPNDYLGHEDYTVLWIKKDLHWMQPGFWNDVPGFNDAEVICQLDYPPVLCSKASAITSNKVLATGLTICEDWKLSVDLKLPNQLTDKWLNVFGIQVATARDSTYGGRIPAIWINAKKQDIYLHICNSMNNQLNVCYNTKTKWNTGKWINLKLSQTNGLYEIRVENKLVHQVVNQTPRMWNNVKVVAGNTYNNNRFVPASGQYRDFKMKTCEKGPSKAQSGNRSQI